MRVVCGLERDDINTGPDAGVQTRSSVPGRCRLSLQTAGSVSNSDSRCRMWSILEYVVDSIMCYRCGGVADYVIRSVCKTGCRVWELACLFVVGRSWVVILIVRRGVLIEVNEEIQNSQLHVCPTMFPVFHPLNFFHSSEPQKYIIVDANTKYKCSVCNFRVEWKLTL